MANENYNLKDYLMHEINEIIKINTSIKNDFEFSSRTLTNLITNISALENNQNLLKNNPKSQIENIQDTIIKIRTILFSIKKNINEISNLDSFNLSERDNLRHEFNEIITYSNVIKEKIRIFNTTSVNELNESKNESKILNNFLNFTVSLQEFHSEISSSLSFIFHILIKINKEIENLEINYELNTSYIERFKEDTSLIIKKYKNEISTMTEQFSNSLKNLKLDQDKALKSTVLLNNNAELGIKNLTQINKRIQEVELELSHNINSEKESIKNELKSAKDDLDVDINFIIAEAKAKAQHIDIQTENIKTSHKDFLKIVEKSAIYELTQNYKNKAEEEKKDYVSNRRWTVAAICLAILTTVIVIALPIIEHWNANPPIEANYYTVFARLSVSIMFFVLALYTSKQAAKHYECYQENHRTFLQLAALEPFISRMSEEEKLNIRKTLVPIYFNQNAEGKFAAKSDEVDLPTNLHAIVNRAFDVLSEKKGQNNKPSSE